MIVLNIKNCNENRVVQGKTEPGNDNRVNLKHRNLGMKMFLHQKAVRIHQHTPYPKMGGPLIGTIPLDCTVP